MKRNTKTAALIMCFVLAFSVLCGCGKDTEAVNTEAVSEEPAEDAAAASDVEEQTGEAEEASDSDDEEQDEEPVINTLALKGPSYTGQTNLTKTDNEDGSYFYQDMTEDGLTVITNMCYPNSQRDGQDPDAYAENFVCAVVDGTDSVKIIKSGDDEKVSSATTYPSYRVDWETGSNEDTRQNVGVVVLTDNFTYYYGYGCPIDYYEENADFYTGELDSIELIDLADFGSANTRSAGGLSGKVNGGYDVYLDKINELKSEGLADQFTLAYINDNGSDTPELIASDSTGSFDHENAFIFSVNNGEVVEVASVIAGVDGANLDYAIGANLIHISGAVVGMRDSFYRIENGKLEEVLVAEASSMEEDAKYSINGENVKKDAYYEQINTFMEPYNPLIRIAYDGLYEVEYKYDNGYGGFEQGSSESYTPASEITGK